MKRALLYPLLILSGLISHAQTHDIYSLNVHFFPEDAQMWGYDVSNKAFMRGNMKVQFAELDTDTLTFYLHGELKVDSIVSGNEQLNYGSRKVFYRKDYSYLGLETHVYSSGLGPDDIMEVYYSGFMNPSRARSLSDYFYIDEGDGVFLRAYYYSPWFPVFEKPGNDDYTADFEHVTVSLPANFKVVVCGELLMEINAGDLCTTTWKPGITKISDIQCTAREYEVISGDNVFVYHVGGEQNGNQIIDFATGLKELFSSHLGRVHDTSSLYIIEMPEYGNISSQNVIGISGHVYNNFDHELYSKLTIAHELVHPYVYIPLENNNEFASLVVEGFPSFFHLYGMARTMSVGDFDMKAHMKAIEKSYVSRRQTGTDRRGNTLPPEKPILKISYDEIGLYKDRFVLPDRVRLFLYHLWTKMGDERYDQFLKELFSFNSIDYEKFEDLIVTYIPGYEDQLNTWLNTVEYPASFYINE